MKRDPYEPLNHDVFSPGYYHLNLVFISLMDADNKDLIDNKASSLNIDDRPDLKEAATEMLAEQRILGEFKDKKSFEEATDLQIGPDIRYALTSTNSNFLRRILWGPLTSAEYREVYHRLKELKWEGGTSKNILKGQIIDIDKI
ncbi:hypothetical protein ACFL7M_01625 [Thermodesulfobacteriota bacterium]